jgi:hypothetical protein
MVLIGDNQQGIAYLSMNLDMVAFAPRLWSVGLFNSTYNNNDDD